MNLAGSAASAILFAAVGAGTAKAEPAAPAGPATAPTTRPATVPGAPAARPTTVPTTPEIERLLADFLNPDWKMRQKAQEQLAAMADAAEPRLRQFVATTDNAEARARAQTALLQMASARKMGPTLVTLHLKEARPRTVFAELARQAHLPITPLRESLWNQMSKDALTLDAADEPFWSVMRRACAALGVRALFAGGDEEQSRIVLTRDPTGEMNSPVTFSGSFMVLVSSLARKSAFEGGLDAKPEEGKAGEAKAGIANGGNAAEPTSGLTAEFTFFADPKWRIVDHPEKAVIESVMDDKGRALPVPEPMHMQAFKPENPIWLMRTDVPKVPVSCQKLGRLKGHFRVVLLEESDPIEVDKVMSAHNVLRKVAGRTVQVRETVKEGEVYKLKVTIFRNGLSTQEWRQQRESQGITLLDEKGRALPRGGYNAEENGDQVDYDLTFLNADGANGANGVNAINGGVPAKEAPAGQGAGNPPTSGGPAKLVIQLPLEPREMTVPFEFKDLPIEK